MKKDLKRQIITALAVTAVLGAAGGMTAQATDIDHILASQDTINDANNNGVLNGESYWYGVVGGNTYVDTQTTKTIDNISGLLAIMDKGEASAQVGAISAAIKDKTEEIGMDAVSSDKNGLNLIGASEEGYRDFTRFYGAVGGDLALNINLNQKGGQDLDEIPAILVNNSGIENRIEGGNLVGGVGGSAAIGIGNVEISASAAGLTLTYDMNGTTVTTVNGNVVTNVAKDTNVIGWMNGGLAAGIGGTASSTVNGSTTITINGDGKKDGTNESAGNNDKLPQITEVLNWMDDKQVSAIGVTGGGAAVTTLGGTADAVVGGSTNITVTDASVVGLIGGGAAASVDATGVGSALVNNPVGNDDGTSGFGITADGNLATGNDPTEQNAPIHVDLTNVNQGGTATSKTGDTYIKLEGDGTAIGVFGGGAAAASHTYQLKTDQTGVGDKGNEYGSSTAAAETGKSHITINLAGDGKTDKIFNGYLSGRGEALGVFGGGAAFAYSKTGNGVADGSGASAAATTKGSEIIVTGTGDKKDHVGGLFGGGAAVAFNWAKATAEMTDTVDITIENADVSGAVGGGLAYFTGSAKKNDTSTYGLEGMATAAAKDTNINVQDGSTVAGILGGGIAIDDSEAATTNAVAKTDGTATINVNGGTVTTVDVSGLQGALTMLGQNDAAGYIGGITAAAEDAAIAAGGVALGVGAAANVTNAVVNINGGEVKGDIYGGGIAAYGWNPDTAANDGTKDGSYVGTSTINLNGGKVDGNVYAGGAASAQEMSETHPDYKYATATVDTSTINLAGTEVTGILSGTGKVSGTDGKAIATVDTSTLNLIGKNELGLAGETSSKSSKIQNFTNVVAKAGSETVVTDADANTALISGGKVTVEDGALLNIKDLPSGITAGGEGTDGNTYKIADKTADASTFWDDSDLIYDRMSGVYAKTEVTNGKDGDSDTSFSVKYDKIDTTEEANAAADSMTDALGVKDLRGMFREGMNDGWKKLNKDSGAGKYLDDWQMADNKTPYQRGMLFGEDAAVTGNTVSIARAMADNVTQRLSFTDDYVQEQGWANQDGGVWAKYMHRKYETDGMSSSVGGIHSSTDYDGVLVGMDLAKNGKFQSGVAIHYGSGEGDGLISHNDYDAWGITLYGGLKDEEAGTNLMADIGWMTSDNDIDGTVAGKRMSADRDVDAWTIGIRGEKEFVSGKNQIVPYAGLRYMSVNPGSYTTYYDGQAAFHNDAENQDLWLLPIGVSFRNETATSSGWRITPKLDLSYIWAFGDTDTDMTVNAGGYTGNLYYDVMDDSSWLATLGVEAEKDAWAFGINYGYQKGDDTKNKTWYVTAGYSF